MRRVDDSCSSPLTTAFACNHLQVALLKVQLAFIHNHLLEEDDEGVVEGMNSFFTKVGQKLEDFVG